MMVRLTMFVALLIAGVTPFFPASAKASAGLAEAPEARRAQGAGSGARVAGTPSAAFDVRAFGAKGDGATLDTDAINKAIAAAHAAGGGTVRVPAGSYLSTSIHLQSNVGLFIDHGATIVAADTMTGPYDEPEPNGADRYQDFGHSHWHNALMWGDGIENVSISGPGVIHGKGLVRNHNDSTPRGSGDKAISLKNSRNVVIRDISILHGGWFAILATGADNLTIDNIKIDTNRDGIDVDACRNPRISNATINSPFDFGNIPAYGLYARYVNGLTVHDVQFTVDNADARPAVRLDDVGRGDLDHVVAPHGAAGSLFVLRRVTDFLLRNSPGVPDVKRTSVERESF